MELHCTSPSFSMNFHALQWLGHRWHHDFLHLLVFHNHPGLDKQLVNSASILDDTWKVHFTSPGNVCTNAQANIQSLILPNKNESFFNSDRYTSMDSPYCRCHLMGYLYTMNKSIALAKAVTKAVFIHKLWGVWFLMHILLLWRQ